jgi:hypothetical protein
MKRRRCAACGQGFRPHARVAKQQRYCSKAACQRERRRRWQATTRQGDGDYRNNQVEAQRAWARGRPDYWRRYREAHPAYVERNRAASRERQRARRQQASMFAKMDASMGQNGVPSGTYRLVPAIAGMFAKMDAWTVKITVLSKGSGDLGEAVRGLQREDSIGARGPPC